jgi:hypothetical protein
VALLAGVADPAVHDLAELKPTNKRNQRASSVLNRKPRPFLRETKRKRDPSADLCAVSRTKNEAKQPAGYGSVYCAPVITLITIKASKLKPHTQTDRGTCPGAGL